MSLRASARLLDYPLYIYLLMTVLMGIGVMFKAAVYPGIAGIVGPLLCWWAAAGLTGSLLVGTRSQKLWGLVDAIVFAAVGFGLVYHSGYGVRLFSLELTGVEWCVVGVGIGYLGGKREARSGAAGAQPAPDLVDPRSPKAR